MESQRGHSEGNRRPAIQQVGFVRQKGTDASGDDSSVGADWLGGSVVHPSNGVVYTWANQTNELFTMDHTTGDITLVDALSHTVYDMDFVDIYCP